jgi:hypothetical protein
MKQKTWRSIWGNFQLPDDLPPVFTKTGRIRWTDGYSGLVNKFILDHLAERAEQPKEERDFVFPSFQAWVNSHRPHDLPWGSVYSARQFR